MRREYMNVGKGMAAAYQVLYCKPDRPAVMLFDEDIENIKILC